jgi:hypothetical protein
MLMTTWKLILLRLFNITLGRIAFIARTLRRVLVRALITGKSKKYVASSRFFDPKELRQDADEMEAESTTE